ncbi:TetR/AcrR family transcriptional regulator [Gordonia hydrophobica]|uniref:TetR/AcrR family transcriptional regulator n=1 Tax=Gordonia hydrophobica TaxID=40516 RepID=A0ABZ2U4N9_9ACTN|nr:TetR/AcrR family transcriptional regulator [Gordonia hydrophobica]MBM7366899.1 AcrR family transcriptional regulator [Gordonia hydrophobica]
MGRPRRYDVDDLLDHARTLWLTGGVAAVTIRALSTASGASNGAVYHAFGSRAGVLARVWARDAHEFLVFQQEHVTAAMAEDGPVAAFVAAALAPATYAENDVDGARVLLAADRDELLTPELDESSRTMLDRLRSELGQLSVQLSAALWDRTDRPAVTAIRHGVVDLPGALLLRGEGVADPVARHVLEQAVRGIAAAPPPRPAT